MNNGERKPRNSRRDQFLFIISYTKFEMKKIYIRTRDSAPQSDVILCFILF